MDFILPVVMLLVGIGLGGAVIWFVLQSKIQQAGAAAKAEAEAERATLTERLQNREQGWPTHNLSFNTRMLSFANSRPRLSI